MGSGARLRQALSEHDPRIGVLPSDIPFDPRIGAQSTTLFAIQTRFQDDLATGAGRCGCSWVLFLGVFAFFFLNQLQQLRDERLGGYAIVFDGEESEDGRCGATNLVG